MSDIPVPKAQRWENVLQDPAMKDTAWGWAGMKLGVKLNFLSLENDVACDFPAGAEGFLWFAVELRLHTTGVT